MYFGTGRGKLDSSIGASSVILSKFGHLTLSDFIIIYTCMKGNVEISVANSAEL